MDRKATEVQAVSLKDRSGGRLGRIRCVWMAMLICMTCVIWHSTLRAQMDAAIILHYQHEPTGRIAFGAERLKVALQRTGFQVSLIPFDKAAKEDDRGRDKIGEGSPINAEKQFSDNWHVYIGTIDNSRMQKAILMQPAKVPSALDSAQEGFWIQGFEKKGNDRDIKGVLIAGADKSGALYGCLELGQQLEKLEAALKAQASEGRKNEVERFLLHYTGSDQPQMRLRGACIGLQKPYLLPGHGTYEYPYTKKNFPWFYNKSLWIKYLDMLVDNRMNTLYLWSGHPFASLVRLKAYPDAVEVDSATFAANQQMFQFLTTEANKRGIWVIQAFYNIIVSKPFAEKHHIKTQDRNRPITPLIADYTRKSIAAFVKKYPNVGLLVTLGEAMEGVGPDDTKWFTQTIIPGVKDGLRALGQKQQPPIILRAHDADAPAVMAAAKPIYSNLFTMAKYNGEALTTYQPRGPWAALHRKLSAIAPVQIENVHILANLEPFRYGADDFIQKCVQAMHKVYGSNGLHIYPQASYWDWPYSADKADPRILQINRDWIWYAQWARYAWNADRDRSAEKDYWSGRLARQYGSDLYTGRKLLEAYEASGQIAPKLLRRYGITDGNRQTLSLGMLMSQLIDPEKYGLFTLLYNSESPKGEMITQYAKKEWLHQKHIGETPMQIAREVVAHAAEAVGAIRAAERGITKNKSAFDRLKNDMLCYQHLAAFYSHKVRAAFKVLRYGYSHELTDLTAALPLLAASVDDFAKLTASADAAYLYANSLQTGARKIPLTGKGGQNKTWSDLLPVYQNELSQFKKNIQALKKHGEKLTQTPKGTVLQAAEVSFLSPSSRPSQKPPVSGDAGKRELASDLPGSYDPGRAPGIASGRFKVGKAGQPFTDTTVQFDTVAGLIQGLQGIQVDRGLQIKSGTRLCFTTDKPVRLLVGFFTKKDKNFLKEPELETDASANDYGQAATKIANAAVLPGFPNINIHSYQFDKGTHTLQLGKGICLLLGFVANKQELPSFDARLGAEGSEPDLDWLFR